MKTFFLLIIILFANACKTTKENSDTNSIEEHNVVMEECPEKGECTLKVMKNSSLTIKEDTIGQIYPVIEKGDYLVVEYTFLIKGPEGTADGNYSETLHFEIPNATKQLNLKDATLQDVDLLFGKHCFCKGEAGYYKVKKGELKLSKTSKELSIEVTYIVYETTQKTKQLSKTIQL